MAWEFKNGVPIYLQIVDGIKIRIAGGELPPGSKIPSVRDLAAEAGVNPNTMQRALTQLEQEGLLHAQRTSGRYVTEDEQKMKELRRSLSEKYVEELFTQLSRLGMTREEITLVRPGTHRKVRSDRIKENEGVNKLWQRSSAETS